MANLLNSVSSEFSRLMIEYETICIPSIVKSITVSLHSSEALEAAASRPTNTLHRGIKSGVRSEINYLRVNLYLMSIIESRMSIRRTLRQLYVSPRQTTICKNLIHFSQWKGQSTTIQMLSIFKIVTGWDWILRVLMFRNDNNACHTDLHWHHDGSRHQ
jgi:hypothetical protein